MFPGEAVTSRLHWSWRIDWLNWLLRFHNLKYKVFLCTSKSILLIFSLQGLRRRLIVMDAKDEVKSRLSVEDVVGQYLELKKAGRNFKGLSPFTSEKTPSFIVSPEKQIWHDFSSNKGGDIFTFVMEMEGVDFREALNILARKAGVEVQQYGDGGKTTALKKRIYEILDLSATYYQKTLVKNPVALDYIVKKRKFNKQTLRDFRLGYAPSNGKALVDFLKKKNYEDSEIKAAGLTSSYRGGLNDMFRGRIMVPLADREGRIIGFTARILKDDNPKAPKYINTPQTLVYDKSRHVFGLHLAKEAIRNSNYSVMVEGNLDVIASHQASVNNVVATAGTALTTHQLIALSRLGNEVRLAFDQDDAGIRATERAISLSQDVDVSLYVIDIPEGKDPDDLIRKDPKLWPKAVDSQQYALDWLLAKYSKEFDLSSAKGKREMTTKFIKVLAALSDTVEQDHYVGELAKITDTSYDAMSAKLTSFNKSKQKSPPKKMISRDIKSGTDEYAYQDNLLAINLCYPDTRNSLRKVKQEYLRTDERRDIYLILKKLGSKSFKEHEHDLHSLENYAKILTLKAQELYGDWSSSDRTIEAIGLARRCEQDNIQKQRKELTEKIRLLEEEGETEQAKELLAQYNDMLKRSNN